MSPEILEKRLKPDWKQWIPVTGVFKMFKDKREGKPNLIEDFKYWSEYQSITFTLALFGAGYGLKKLFEYSKIFFSP